MVVEEALEVVEAALVVVDGNIYYYTYMSIFDFLFGSKISTTSFDSLRKKIIDLRKSNIYPFNDNLAESISFPNDFWDDLIKIFKKTDKDGLERAFSIFWADGEIVFSEVKTGSDRMVTSGGSIQVKYSHHPTRQGYARKEVILNDSVLKRKDVFYEKVPKSLDVQYLFNIHTHPKHTTDDGKVYYNFFSAQDIKSLISSKAVITALITDKLWLLIRTKSTPSDVSNLLDSQVTPEYVQNTLHMGLYKANFNNKAYRYDLIEK